MGIGPRLELRQTAQLVMTPQLRQAIRLLQMTNLEVGGFVEAELERNPMLERAAAGEGPILPPEPPPPGAAAEAGADVLIAAADPGHAATVLDAPREAVFDEAPADLPPGDGGPGRSRASEPAGGGGIDPGELAGSAETLRAHLLAQIGMARVAVPVRALAAGLVDELDEGGYLRVPDEELMARWGVPAGLLAEALAVLRACEPTGVGARDLADCLALQLQERGRLDPAAKSVLAHLALVGEGRYDAVMSATGLSAEDVADVLADLRRLDPRPGRAFDSDPVVTVVPDVLVRRDRSGELVVDVNPDTLPRLRLASAYATRFEGRDTRAFLSECRTSAGWLIRTLEHRSQTIVKVASELVRRQHRFFSEGVTGLRPMALRDVAEAVGLHESTVSRVTSGKYLACERGLFEFRFFFSQGLAASDGGDARSATVIRDRIRRMIEAEDPRNVLSDDTIVQTLRGEGIEIARRTVAKYREGMNIPSSVQRRRLKARVDGA